METTTNYQAKKQGDASGGWILLDYGFNSLINETQYTF
jgi:hypothetical protein